MQGGVLYRESASACVFHLSIVGVDGVNVISDEVITDYSDDNTGRANVLLNTAVDNAVLCYVYRL